MYVEWSSTSADDSVKPTSTFKASGQHTRSIGTGLCVPCAFCAAGGRQEIHTSSSSTSESRTTGVTSKLLALEPPPTHSSAAGTAGSSPGGCAGCAALIRGLDSPSGSGSIPNQPGQCWSTCFLGSPCWGGKRPGAPATASRGRARIPGGDPSGGATWCPYCCSGWGTMAWPSARSSWGSSSSPGPPLRRQMDVQLQLRVGPASMSSAGRKRSA
mmetsp:Transcript_31665/g.89213  ORF Transcript_31665/g.89213 Transcript_31665/m.89213 type:complete len:214 (+) Transcript_31665:31-672(+)